jgi:hypothetical protein
MRYFRKKNKSTNDDDKQVKNKKKRTYISMDKRILEEMDKHIIMSIRRQQANNEHYMPATGFADFCKLYDYLLSVEHNRLHIEHNIDKDAINDKIKKHYKNRYFIIIS